MNYQTHVQSNVPNGQSHRNNYSNIHSTHDVVEAVPLYEDVTDSSNSDLKKFITVGYQDKWAALLFIVFITITIALSIYYWPMASHTLDQFSKSLSLSSNDTSISQSTDSLFLTSRLIYGTIGGSIAAVILSLLLLSLLSQFPKQFIIGCNLINVLSMAIAGIYLSITNHGPSNFITIILLVIAGINLLWLYLVRHRIPFASIMLKISINIIKQYKSTICVSLLSSLLVIVYGLVTLSLQIPFIINLQNLANQGNTQDTNLYTFIFVLAIFTLFWVSQVCMNIVHVTISGLTATWYFVGSANMPKNPTKASFIRAITTSFGSICLGSLLVAIIKTIRQIIEQSRSNDNGFIVCIADCLITMIERLLEYFNTYAYTYVAIYGMKYTEAASRTWNLAKNCGYNAYFNDCLIDTTLGVLSVGLAAIVGIVTYLIYHNIIIVFINILVVLGLSSTVFQCISSVVPTVFVCCAESPKTLAQFDFELYQEIHESNNIV